MHLRVILPITGDISMDLVQSEAQAWASASTRVDVVRVARGTASIESAYDEALAGPGILSCVNQAVDDGVDGVFITCFGDPGVHAAREVVDLPVVGGFEPAMFTALTLGEHVGIVTILPNVIHMQRLLGRRYGIADRIGGIRSVELPVLDLSHDQGQLIEHLHGAAAEMVAAGVADVIVLGCTGMLGVAKAVQDRLEADGVFVPVVDPTAAAINWLEGNVRMGLRPSRVTFMTPPPKQRDA